MTFFINFFWGVFLNFFGGIFGNFFDFFVIFILHDLFFLFEKKNFENFVRNFFKTF